MAIKLFLHLCLVCIVFALPQFDTPLGCAISQTCSKKITTSSEQNATCYRHYLPIFNSIGPFHIVTHALNKANLSIPEKGDLLSTVSIRLAAAAHSSRTISLWIPDLHSDRPACELEPSSTALAWPQCEFGTGWKSPNDNGHLARETGGGLPWRNTLIGICVENYGSDDSNIEFQINIEAHSSAAAMGLSFASLLVWILSFIIVCVFLWGQLQQRQAELEACLLADAQQAAKAALASHSEENEERNSVAESRDHTAEFIHHVHSDPLASSARISRVDTSASLDTHIEHYHATAASESLQSQSLYSDEHILSQSIEVTQPHPHQDHILSQNIGSFGEDAVVTSSKRKVDEDDGEGNSSNDEAMHDEGDFFIGSPLKKGRQDSQ